MKTKFLVAAGITVLATTAAWAGGSGGLDRSLIYGVLRNIGLIDANDNPVGAGAAGVANTRQILTTGNLSGGGDLSADRTISISATPRFTGLQVGASAFTSNGQADVMADQAAAEFVSTSYGTGFGGGFRGRSARGTLASPTASQSGDLLAFFGGRGYGATGFSSTSVGRYGIYAAENWTDSAQGTDIQVETTPTGSITRTVRGIWTSQGLMVLGANKVNTVPALKPSGTTLAARLGDDSAEAPFSCASVTGPTNADFAIKASDTGAGGQGHFITLTAGAGANSANAGGGVFRLTGGASFSGTNGGGGGGTVTSGAGDGSGNSGSLTFASGVPGATGGSGNVTINTGAGGATSGGSGNISLSTGTPVDGAGGAISLAAASGFTTTSTDRNGGALSLTGGNAAIGGSGGSITGTAGAGGTTGGGGSVLWTSGAGGSTSGNSGATSLISGNAADGNTGTVNLTTGNASTATSANRQAGAINLTVGTSTGNSTGGAITATAGNAGATGVGGTVTFNAGPGGSTSGNGGQVVFNSGTVTDGNGGAITFTAKNGASSTSTNRTGGTITLTCGTGAFGGGGGAFTASAGAGGATGSGAAVNVNGGAGGSTSGNGGDCNFNGGIPVDGNGGAVAFTARNGVSSTSTNRNGGGISLTAGNAAFGGNGGNITGSAGSGGATGGGGAVTWSGGAGGSTSGNGGGVTVQGGLPIEGNGGAVTLNGRNGVTASATNRNGGSVNLNGGDCAVAGSPGQVNLTGGAGGTTTTGGQINIISGAGGSTSGASGAATFKTGTPIDGAGGSISITAADGATTTSAARNGGSVTITAGASTTAGTPGLASLIGGAGNGTDNNSGGVTINAGNSTGAGTSTILFKAAPTAATGTGANTAATIFTLANSGVAVTSGTPKTALLASTFSDGGATSTTTAIALNIVPTINYTAASKTGSYRALEIDVTETSLPSGQNFLILAKTGATTAFSVDNTGAVVALSNFYVGNGANGRWNSAGLEVLNTGYVAWAPSTNATAAPDTIMARRGAAGAAGLSNGTNPTLWHVYNTTDADNGAPTNFERFEVFWSSNQVYLRTEAGGTGSQRALNIGTRGAASLGFRTNDVARWSIDSNGHLQASGTDNTYDIGASGATRPRNVYVGTSITSPKLYLDYTNTGTVGNVTINKAAGRVNIAAAGTTVTVTDSVVTAASHVLVVMSTADSTGRVISVVPSAGSFVINTVAVTAQTSFDFVVINAD